MTRRLQLAALAAAVVLGLSACANNDAKRGDVVDAMTDAGLDQDQADCIADGIDGEYGDDQDTYNEIAAADEPDELPEGAEETITSILDQCLGEGGTGGDAEGDAEDGDQPEDGSTTTESTTEGG
ncbi:MAG TPA: hypothetical protein VKZ72_04320 [Acidimicrobiales bacterium]|jgi:hypothetical protein|nr:hypothetical protein [Acidimicrobiales bacterium]